MPHPPFGMEKEVTICDSCGDTLVIPPGRYYRGQKLHKHCAILLQQQNFSNEIEEPYLDLVEQQIEEILDTG